jgi:type IV pilus assembly protein PilQ
MLRWFLYAAMFTALIMPGCVTGKTRKQGSETPSPVFIEGIGVDTTGQTSTVEISFSSSTPYSAFKVLNPSRIIVDVPGEPGPEVSGRIHVNKGYVESITTEAIGKEISTTRITVYLEGEPDYTVSEKGSAVMLSIFPASTASEPIRAPIPEYRQVHQNAGDPAEPRIFFPPENKRLHLVRGLDFMMLEGGKSRFIVTTSDNVAYSLRRAGDKEVLLTLEKCSIPDLLKREIDSRCFEGVVEKAAARFVPDRSQVEILVTLKEMVPYHVVQEKDEIRVDFFKTLIQPPKIQLEPARVMSSSEKAAPQSSFASKQQDGQVDSINGNILDGSVLTGAEKKYTGTPMTMEFVDADVTSILRLIGEVSNLNIIWGPEVTGTVSMRLRKVPWDQVLDLVLANNELGKEVRGNVIWVTTRRKIEELKAAERKAIEEERKRKLAEKQEMKELEPLETQYFPLDFANAVQIKSHLDEIKTKERGTLTVDERTNTLIMRDTAATLAEAKKIIERFDTPVKQIMIEARIVDATTGFSRDLGVQWTNVQRKWKKHESQDWGSNPEAYSRYGDLLVGGNFVTDAPPGWAGNLGLSIARLTNRGLGTLALDATLALAETEEKVRIISAPRVIASNGEEAVISRGAEIIREIVTADQIGVETVEATLSLTVTPTVSFNDFVTMKLKVTDDKPYEDGSGNINKKEINTTLMVQSGETIVIGGIYTEDNQEIETGVPLLRHIPFISWLFKARTNIKDKTELLIFITPRVIETARPGRKAL